MRTAVLVVFVVLLQACASTPERNPVPEELLPQVVVPGIPNARSTVPRTADEVEAMTDRLHVTAVELAAGVGTGPYSDFLAISGGGSEGAFGAGLLVGWSAAGTRPEFQVISGVSTGALIAPFVFAGPEYDDVLETFYTTTDTEDIMDKLGLIKILRGPALADTGPLREIIATSIDDEFLAKVAAEHRKGRRLVIGTTNLDAQTPVVWNMGAIAESGQPNALQLFRDVILASASVPGVFPPVLVEVEAGGRRFDEMHVDGGVSAQVFTYPAGLELGTLRDAHGVTQQLRIFMIRNSKVLPEYNPVEPKLIDIAGVSGSLLIRSQGNANITQSFEATQRDGVEFRLAYIPPTFDDEPEEAFDQDYMKKLYDMTYDLAINGYPWSEQPPWFDTFDLN